MTFTSTPDWGEMNVKNHTVLSGSTFALIVGARFRRRGIVIGPVEGRSHLRIYSPREFQTKFHLLILQLSSSVDHGGGDTYTYTRSIDGLGDFRKSPKRALPERDFDGVDRVQILSKIAFGNAAYLRTDRRAA